MMTYMYDDDDDHEILSFIFISVSVSVHSVDRPCLPSWRKYERNKHSVSRLSDGLQWRLE